ncbi:MAG: hypothetical protein IT558_04660 [Alphaproteobacteria bacterium]|nr:hypothetical protein [Alphaproteobacteria bacterium]
MFWSGRNKDKDKKTGKQAAEGAALAKPAGQNIKDSPVQKSQTPAGAELRAQALANVRAAREALGEDTIQKIAEAITKKQGNPTEQARAKIIKTDPTLVADEIIGMLDKKK